MSNNVYFGLDNTQKSALRAVSILVEQPFAVSVQGWRRCKSSEQFQSFVDCNFAPAAVAASPLPHDPCDAIEWASRQNLAVQRHTPRAQFDPSDLDPTPDLPPSFKRAYSLALRAAYVVEAPEALASLSREIYWARDALERLERSANILSHHYDFQDVPF